MERVTVPTEELMEILLLQIQGGASAQLAITGTSMNPMLRENRDFVTVRKPQTPLKKGDIILYKRSNGKYVLHRIVKVTENGYNCCGDNQWKREPVGNNQILAVVTAFTRKGKTCNVLQSGYRIYVFFRMLFRPVRRPVLAIRHGMQKLVRFLYKKTSE